MSNKVECIYKLHSSNLDNNNKYIGSTKHLQRRMSMHTYRNKNNILPHLYGGLEHNYFVEILEETKGLSTNELKQKERYYIETCIEPTLNKIIPLRTKKEWRRDNLEYYNKKRMENYYKNHEENKRKKREYYAKKKKEKSQIILE